MSKKVDTVAGDDDREQDGRVIKSHFLKMVSQRSGVEAGVVKDVYNAMYETMLDVVVGGNSLMLTNLGSFSVQHHQGHYVQFSGDADAGGRINDYKVLKFSAARTINKKIESMCAQAEQGEKQAMEG